MMIAPGLAIGLLIALGLVGYVLVVGARRRPRPRDGGPMFGDPLDHHHHHHGGGGHDGDGGGGDS